MIFIADNVAEELTNLQDLLKRLFPTEYIWPSDEKPFTKWDDVSSELRTNTENNKDLLVILDLGLESEHMSSATEGLSAPVCCVLFGTKLSFWRTRNMAIG